MSRPRACAALIVGDKILMVRHREKNRVYWTLPGGGVESGESFAEAAVRELFEETGVRGRAMRPLWEGTYGADISPEVCFLIEIEGAEQHVVLGADPEEVHLKAEDRQLQGVDWRPLTEVADDPQVARVLYELRIVTG